ncbi:MAG: hypothetical protein ACT4OS_01095 [Acidimicrobiales bacterium]
MASALPSIVDGDNVADLELRRHVSDCPRCQAEVAQYRRLLKVVRQLRTEVIEPTPGLFPDILAALEEASERQAIGSLLSGRRGAYVGGLAVATAAGAASAMVLATRSRRHRLHLAG